MRRFRTTAVLVATLATALLLGACGGSPEGLIEAASRSAGADIDDLEFDEDGGTFSASLGDAQVTFGGDRPDWLESQFVLPEGLEIQAAINDPSTGERAITGIVPGGNVDTIAAEQVAVLTAAGYEQLGDSFNFVAPGQVPIELLVEDAGTGVYYSLEHRLEDEQVLRDVFAPVEATGSMAVTLDDIRYIFEGPCSLRSSSGQFETADPANGSGSVTVEVREGSQNYILADIIPTSEDPGEFASWTMLQVDEDGNFPAITVGNGGFNVQGFMTNWADGSVAPVVISVACPG